MSGRLTKTAVEGLRPPSNKTGQAFLWDGELKGFGVRAIHSGLKTFILQYRDADGRSRRIKLGRFGAITAEAARDLAKVKFGQLVKGDDPRRSSTPGGKQLWRPCAIGILKKPRPAAFSGAGTGRSKPRRSQWTRAGSKRTSSRSWENR